MPITVYPSPTSISPYQPYLLNQADITPILSVQNLFERAIHDDITKLTEEIFQSSFDVVLPSTRNPSLNIDSFDNETLYASSHSNSFVHVAVQAYSNHNHLIIRPDDIWISILSQFNLFINANAEAMRKYFVQHEGKKQLVVTAVGTRYTVDFGAMADSMSREIEKNVIDKELREWFMPEFSTTQDNDRVVASVILMATLKQYFDYSFHILCGLPAVTLIGEKRDWEILYSKIGKLKTFGEQTRDWHNVLEPVLRHFILSFEEPDSERVKGFWQRIAHVYGGGSGPDYLSGWITAFSFFDEDGKSMYHPFLEVQQSEALEQLDAGELVQPLVSDIYGGFGTSSMDPTIFKLEGVLFHPVDMSKIPPGYAEVDVHLDDNGEEFDCKMVAGLLAARLTDSGEKSSPRQIKVIQGSYYNRPYETVGENEEPALKRGEKVVNKTVGIYHDGKKDVVQPVAGWFMFAVDKEKEKKINKAIEDEKAREYMDEL